MQGGTHSRNARRVAWPEDFVLKAVSALALALLISAGAAVPAGAFTPGGFFKLSGPMTVRVAGSAPAACTISLNLNSTPFGTSVVGAVFGGACINQHPFQLPWAVTATSPTTVTISPMSFGSTFACTASSVTGTWNNAAPGVLTLTSISMPPICVIDATLSASPAQTLP
jgi:hypothetical protein